MARNYQRTGRYEKPFKTLVRQGGNKDGRNRLRDENSKEPSQPDERSRAPAISRLKYEDGRALGPDNRTIVFARSFRIRVLEFLASGGGKEAARQQFKLTPKQLQRILDGKGGWGKPKRSIVKLERAVIKEFTLRQELYRKAVEATAAALDDNDDYRRGIIGVKVLEGLGDFRRAGDEIPRDAPRQPLFNLPAGSHVAIEIRTGGELPVGNIAGKEIPTLEGETNGSDDGNTTQCGRELADASAEQAGILAEENRSADEGMETRTPPGAAPENGDDGIYFGPDDLDDSAKSDAEDERSEAVGAAVQIRESSGDERDYPGEFVREG